MKIYNKRFIDFCWKIKELDSSLRLLRNPLFCKDLSDQEIKVIGIIGDVGEISMKKLSELTSIKPNTLTGVILKLQNKKIVDRYIGDDRRLVIIDFDPEWKNTYQIYVREQEKIAEMIVKTVGEEKLEMMTKLILDTTEQLREKAPAIKRTV